MSNESKPMPFYDRTLSIKNGFMRMYHPTTLLQEKFICLLLSAVQHDNLNYDGTGAYNNFTYTFTAPEYIDFVGGSRDIYDKLTPVTYQDFTEQLQNIKTSWVECEKDEAGNIHTKTYASLVWVPTVEIQQGTSTTPFEVRLRLNPQLIDLLVKLKDTGYFTQYQLGTLLIMPTLSSMRLYQFIFTYKNQILEYNKTKQFFPIPFEELREALGYVIKERDGKKYIEGEGKNSYIENKYFYRLLSRAIDTINAKLELTGETNNQSYYRIECSNMNVKLPDRYTKERCLGVWFHQCGCKQIYAQIANESEDKKEYCDKLGECYHKNIKRKVGVKITRKFEECFDAGVRYDIVERAINKAKFDIQFGTIQNNIPVERYVREVIDKFISDSNNENETLNSDQELYFQLISWFIKTQCSFEEVDSTLKNTIYRWNVADVDVRVILSALYKAEHVVRKRDINPDDNKEGFNVCAYITSIVEKDIFFSTPYVPQVAHMDLQWFSEQLKSPKLLDEVKVEHTNYAEKLNEEIHLTTDEKKTYIQIMETLFSDRAMTFREDKYYKCFIRLGFDADAIVYAAEISNKRLSRTNLDYMLGILSSWAKRNWHDGLWIRNNDYAAPFKAKVDENGYTEYDKEWIEEFMSMYDDMK